MDLRIRSRAALITGAAGGIGRAVARALAAEGVRLALVDRDEAAVRDAVSAVLADAAAPAPTVVRPLVADVTDEAALDAAVQRAGELLDGLDLLVVCAGISGPVGTPLAQTPASAWDAVMNVNARGAFLALRAAVPLLRRSDAASVVMISSDSAFVAAPGMAPYCASKAAVLQLARAAAVELRGDGIRVNAICPSVVDTPMSRGDLGLRDGFGGQDYPVQSADEIAAQVAFLCSPASRPIDGAGLVSDFGYSAGSGFPA
ncbi:SDR family oxidoreductase [Microbacterium protaetiae]|uniref:SDR family oxidoreductase n=1 Tax=Microbacterium protaetiae TaxID=2509458 RepID=A0A4P6E9U5_9MICO|nr:SDR family oxidoreductase [Microbacterium protaetiae]QAY58892.1 SDR family oxidoreductase [Microbacterium protaetiae]